MTAPEIVGASAALKARTGDHHHRAERSEFQRLMVSGRLPQRQYVRWLGQMHAIHSALEDALAAPSVRAQFAGLMTSDRHRTPDLIRDLGHFDAAAGTPLPAVATFAARLGEWAARGGAELAGVFYVFEGSTNGGRHIARGVRKGYALEGSMGTAFLDPYGEAQGKRWREFKDALDRAVTDATLPAAIAGAEAAFDAVRVVGDELLATRDRSADDDPGRHAEPGLLGGVGAVVEPAPKDAAGSSSE